MRLFVRRTLQIAAVSGGLWALGAGVAQAEEPSIPTPDTSSSQGDSTSGDNGVLSGNQINPDVHAPITICGNAVAVLGDAQAHCQPDQSSGSDDGDSTSGDNGVLSGNQINPDVHAPITVCGNAVGEAEGDCPSGGAAPGGPGGPGIPGVPGVPPQGPPQPGHPAGGGPSAAGVGGGLAQTGASAPMGLSLLGLMFLLTGFGALRLGTRRARLAGESAA